MQLLLNFIRVRKILRKNLHDYNLNFSAFQNFPDILRRQRKSAVRRPTNRIRKTYIICRADKRDGGFFLMKHATVISLFYIYLEYVSGFALCFNYHVYNIIISNAET